MTEIEKQNTDDTIPIACDLSVFTPEERDHHMQVVGRLFGKVVEVRESKDGYAMRVPDEGHILFTIADFINDERRCCPFFHFGMEVEPGSKAIWFTLKGGTDIKAELMGLLSDEVAFTVDDLNM